MIVNYIDAQNSAYLKAEMDPLRMEAMGARGDPRVDVCLYFIAAHRLKGIDIRFMKAISEKVMSICKHLIDHVTVKSLPLSSHQFISDGEW